MSTNALLYEFLLFLILGVWLMLSPYVLGFTKQYNPYWNAVAVGAIVTLLSVIGCTQTATNGPVVTGLRIHSTPDSVWTQQAQRLARAWQQPARRPVGFSTLIDGG